METMLDRLWADHHREVVIRREETSDVRDLERKARAALLPDRNDYRERNRAPKSPSRWFR